MNASRQSRIGCRDFHKALRMDRRGFVRAGMLSFAGLSMSHLLRLEAGVTDRSKVSRDKSVIILWMRGGPSQHETWDPKPDAPDEYRGAFGATRTSVPGVHICDLLPMSAKIQHKYSIIRSLHHNDAGHSRGDQICFTGYPPGPADDTNYYPSCGAVVAKQFQAQNPALPAYVVIPRNMPGTGSAYLGNDCRPFETIADPAQEGPFQVPNFNLAEGIDLHRLTERHALLNSFDKARRDADASGQMETMDRFQQQACDIVAGGKARSAFDLDAEPMKVRERYGFMPEYKAPTPDRCGVPAWSQRMLLARRLVEAGVRLVTVDLRWWDTHVKGYESMRDGFLPRWDRAYTALIEDLEQRGMLESTMVLAWGEFGRTPKVNSTGGRDHYPNVFNAAIAGGGLKGGRVIGSSDKLGAEPAERPVKPQEVLATVYRHLGVDTSVNYLDHAGRPHPVLPFGNPIEELF
jgi:hypothetical protein